MRAKNLFWVLSTLFFTQIIGLLYLYPASKTGQAIYISSFNASSNWFVSGLFVLFIVTLFFLLISIKYMVKERGM